MIGLFSGTQLVCCMFGYHQQTRKVANFLLPTVLSMHSSTQKGGDGGRKEKIQFILPYIYTHIYISVYVYIFIIISRFSLPGVRSFVHLSSSSSLPNRHKRRDCCSLSLMFATVQWA
mmetsp:Transcript_13812/g.29024  ORF Transcript_13812/g.29024 Transcript_13812/m.29024 type:complete len:117 (-) Transcript_13812:967-1317(-)